MPRRSGSGNIPPHIEDVINFCIDELRETLGRLPDHNELEVRLREEYIRLGIETKVPAPRTLGDRITPWRKSGRVNTDPLDIPWTLGISRGMEIPDDATGAILTVWRHAMANQVPLQFTVRMAKWVSQLRWVPEAGGTIEGAVKNPHNMYLAVWFYSARERQVNRVRGGKSKGMRSGVLDAYLMFKPPVADLFKRMGRLEDDSGINYREEMRKLNPIANEVATKGLVVAPPRLRPFYPDHEDASIMLHTAFQALSPSVEEATTEQRQDYMEALYADLLRRYQDTGKLDGWVPPIEEIIGPL
jgi:hypothetical protein